MGGCSGNCSSCSGSCSDGKKSRLLDVKHKLLILSGKGGVGKSTVAASLAILLAKAGKKVALLDVDFHGPSQPTLFGMKDERLGGNDDGIVPGEKYGVGVVYPEPSCTRHQLMALAGQTNNTSIHMKLPFL